MIELSLPLVEPIISNTHKYAQWELENKIKETIGHVPYTIRWIGNSETAYLETYAYIMLIGTGHSEANILEFKYTIYKLGKKCLQLAEQKLLVEFLCLIQYSRDKYSFLNKYPQIEAIFIKILQYLQQQHTNSDDSTPQNKHKAKVKRKYANKLKSNSLQNKLIINENNSHRSNSISQQFQYEKQLQQIYQSFNKYFQFINLLGSNEYSCTLKLFNNKKIYIIIQKQCYFMIQLIDKKQDINNQSIQNKSKRSNKAQINNSQKNIPSINQSSNDNFDKKQFLDIFNYKNQVQQSNVVPIQRGSQIRKPSTANLLQSLGNVNTPKFSTISSQMQHFPCPQQFEILKNDEKIQNDRTFIDELLNNVVLQSQNEIIKEQPDQKSKKKIIQERMKYILTIKQQLKIVRMKIQDKIRMMDKAEAYPQTLKKGINQISQKLSISKQKKEEKQRQTNINIVKQSIVKKHQAIFLKKQRKTSYNSVKIIPYQHRFQKNQDHIDIQSPLSPNNRKSANPYLQRMERMLSQKAVSRPHSNFKSIIEEQSKKFPRSKSPEPQRLNNQYKIRSLSPKNVNVNVNVNINENLLNPLSYQQTSYQRPFKEAYPKNQSNHNTQYYINPLKPYDAKVRFPFFKEDKRKNNNPESSFIKKNMKLIPTIK